MKYEGASEIYEHWFGTASRKGYAWDRETTVYVMTEGKKLIKSFEIADGTDIDQVELILVSREERKLLDLLEANGGRERLKEVVGQHKTSWEQTISQDEQC